MLNYACIPAKTVLYNAEVYDEARNADELGVNAEGASLDWNGVGKRREKVTKTLTRGSRGCSRRTRSTRSRARAR